MRKTFWKGFFTGIATVIVVTALGTFAFWKWAENKVASRLKPPVLSQARDNYNFKFSTLNGKVKHLDDFKGKVVFVNFWGTWCLPCVAEMPTIQQLYNNFKTDTSVVFIIASRLDSPEKIKAFAEKHHYDLPFYTITDEDIPDALKFNQYPATFVFSRDGAIAAKHINGANWADKSVVEFLRGLE